MNTVTLTGIIDSVSENHNTNGFDIRQFVVKIETSYQDKIYHEHIPVFLFGDKAISFDGKVGDEVFVAGKVKGKKFQDKQGNEKFSASISATEIKFFSRKAIDSKTTTKEQEDMPF